jgi:hypothetical protein
VRLLGRQREREVLDRMLEAAREGHSVLAVYGEPGVGKTALLDYAIEAGADFRVARAVGVEGEMELAFAALHQLCSPTLGPRSAPRRQLHMFAPEYRKGSLTATRCRSGPAAPTTTGRLCQPDGALRRR